MKKIATLLAAATMALATTSCFGPSPEKQYQYRDYFSFTCPSGWRITGEDDYVYSHIISAEKAGSSSSGIVLITLMDAELDIHEMKEMMQESLEEQGVFNDLVFADLAAGNYGKYRCERYGYTGSVLGLKHEAIVFYFTAGDWHYFICQQQTVDDREVNQPGFDRIESTFDVRDGQPTDEWQADGQQTDGWQADGRQTERREPEGGRAI